MEYSGDRAQKRTFFCHMIILLISKRISVNSNTTHFLRKVKIFTSRYILFLIESIIRMYCIGKAPYRILDYRTTSLTFSPRLINQSNRSIRRLIRPLEPVRYAHCKLNVSENKQVAAKKITYDPYMNHRKTQKKSVRQKAERV